MQAKIITYIIGHLSIAEQNQFRKKLIGHNDRSHGGKYNYRRIVLLDKIKHIKPNRGTIIAPAKEADEIIRLLKDYNAKTVYYDIQISEKEFNK